jgi:hypothetical protein
MYHHKTLGPLFGWAVVLAGFLFVAGDAHLSGLYAQDTSATSQVFTIIAGKSESVSLVRKQDVKITATGDGEEGAVAEAEMKVTTRQDIVLLSEKISLEKGDIKTWTIPHHKNPNKVTVSGTSGQLLLLVEQNP